MTEDGPVVFHSLRHTGISRLANHPAIPLVHVRDFARPADPATMQGYVHKIESERVTLAIGEALSGEKGARRMRKDTGTHRSRGDIGAGRGLRDGIRESKQQPRGA